MSITEKTVRDWLPVGAVIVINLITIGIFFGIATARLEAVEKHAADMVIHVPYADKIKQFPTRVEFDSVFGELSKQDAAADRRMERIEDKVDKIYQLLTERNQ